MKTFLAVFFAILFSHLSGQDGGVDVLTLTYHHGINLKKIQEPGMQFIFKQLCTTEIDSIISSGNIRFKDSRVGRIKNCVLEWQIRNDTLVSVIIETDKKKNTQQVILQSTDQFGEAIELKNSDNIIYGWKGEKEDSDILLKLATDINGDRGKLTITTNPK